MTEKFTFPNDKEKTPIVTVEAARNEKDMCDLTEQAVYFKNSSKIAHIILIVLVMLFLGNVVLAAVLSHNFTAAVMYLLVIGAIIYSETDIKRSAKKAAKLIPNNSAYFRYKFYKHHFDFESQYAAASIDYELIARASENSCGFSIGRRNALYPQSSFGKRKIGACPCRSEKQDRRQVHIQCILRRTVWKKNLTVPLK